MRFSRDPLARFGLVLTAAALGLGMATAASAAEPAESDMDGLAPPVLPACADGGTVGTPKPAPAPQARTAPKRDTGLAGAGAMLVPRRHGH